MKKDKLYDWMDEAREVAAQLWCDKRVENRVMDTEFAEVIAEKIAGWMEIAAQYSRNADFYRGLIKDCGKTIGKRAYTCDDGTISEDVLALKVVEIIKNDYVNGGEE